jgi:hypothetical protein
MRGPAPALGAGLFVSASRTGQHAVSSCACSRTVPAESVALVIEVSDSSLDRDLGRKSVLYAAAGIPEYWVVDLAGERILIHVDPNADGYLGQVALPFGEPLPSATIAGLDLGVVHLVARSPCCNCAARRRLNKRASRLAPAASGRYVRALAGAGW